MCVTVPSYFSYFSLSWSPDVSQPSFNQVLLDSVLRDEEAKAWMRPESLNGHKKTWTIHTESHTSYKPPSSPSLCIVLLKP